MIETLFDAKWRKVMQSDAKLREVTQSDSSLSDRKNDPKWAVSIFGNRSRKQVLKKSEADFFPATSFVLI